MQIICPCKERGRTKKEKQNSFHSPRKEKIKGLACELLIKFTY